MLPRLLIADEAGRVFDHPELAAAMAVGDWLVPAEGLVELPGSASLQALPGWSPIGYDEDTGQYVVVDELVIGGRKIKPRAVGAVLPPGYTRSALPAGQRSPFAPSLPQWAYTAAAMLPGRRGRWRRPRCAPSGATTGTASAIPRPTSQSGSRRA